jgi:hypothetical protein
MGATELVGVAASLSLLAGWRLYAAVLAAGLAMRTGWIDLPTHLQGLAVLASPWIIGIAGVAALAELFADKIAWLDSAWDAVHTAVRPVGGALLALAVVDASDPTWQVATLLLGGGAAFASHAAKASTRAVVNASPEPVSNVALSTTEDVATGGLLWLVLSNPEIAIVVAVLLAIVTVVLLVVAWRVLRTIWVRWKRIVPPPGPDPFR